MEINNIDPIDWKREQKELAEEERSKKFLAELTFRQLAEQRMVFLPKRN